MSVTVTEVLEKLVNIDKAELQLMWDEVKTNSKLLDKCSGHDFSIDLDPDKAVGKHWECTCCGGYVNSSDKYYYELGIKHAKINGTYSE